MPHHKSAEKRVRTNRKRRLRNVAERSRLRATVKKVLAAGSREEGERALVAAASALDRAAKKGVIKTGTADRRKSRLSLLVNKLGA